MMRPSWPLLTFSFSLSLPSLLSSSSFLYFTMSGGWEKTRLEGASRLGGDLRWGFYSSPPHNS